MFIDWVTPATQAAMKMRWLGPAKNAVQKDLENEKSLGDRWCLSVFCNWARRWCDKAHLFLLPYLLQGRLYTDSWWPRNFATLPGRPEFSTRPTFEVGDARLIKFGLWGECHESCRSGVTAEEINEGSFGPERQGRLFSEDIIVDETGAVDPNLGIMAKVSSFIWSAASGRKSWTGVPALGAVYSVACPSQRGCYMVTRRGCG